MVSRDQFIDQLASLPSRQWWQMVDEDGVVEISRPLPDGGEYDDLTFYAPRASILWRWAVDHEDWDIAAEIQRERGRRSERRRNKADPMRHLREYHRLHHAMRACRHAPRCPPPTFHEDFDDCHFCGGGKDDDGRR